MSTPPDHHVDPDDVDEDVHPTGAWILGERIDPDVLDKLHGIVRGSD